MKITIECYPEDLNDAMRAALLVLLTPAPEVIGVDMGAGDEAATDVDALVRGDWTPPAFEAVAAGGCAPPVQVSPARGIGHLLAEIKRADVVLKVGDSVKCRDDRAGRVVGVRGPLDAPDYASLDLADSSVAGWEFYADGRFYGKEPGPRDIVEVNGVRIVDEEG